MLPHKEASILSLEQTTQNNLSVAWLPGRCGGTLFGNVEAFRINAWVIKATTINAMVVFHYCVCLSLVWLRSDGAKLINNFVLKLKKLKLHCAGRRDGLCWGATRSQCLS